MVIYWVSTCPQQSSGHQLCQWGWGSGTDLSSEWHHQHGAHNCTHQASSLLSQGSFAGEGWSKVAAETLCGDMGQERSQHRGRTVLKGRAVPWHNALQGPEQPWA